MATEQEINHVWQPAWAMQGEVARTYGLFADEWQALQEKAGVIDLTHYGLLSIRGEETKAFLNGLVTQQVNTLSTQQVVYTALLTPQGRFLWDFTLCESKEGIFICCEPQVWQELGNKLLFYRLRNKIDIKKEIGNYGLLGLVGKHAGDVLLAAYPDVQNLGSGLGAACLFPDGMLVWRDPRHSDFGYRLLVPSAQLSAVWHHLSTLAHPVGAQAWQHYRIDRALPRGGFDLLPDETLPLEAGFLELNGVDFRKGCYLGQETTARTHYRGTLKRRLYRLTLAAQSSVQIGDRITTAQGKEVGIITSVSVVGPQPVALALLRVSDVEENSLFLAGLPVVAAKPTWATW